MSIVRLYIMWPSGCLGKPMSKKNTHYQALNMLNETEDCSLKPTKLYIVLHITGSNYGSKITMVIYKKS